MLHSNEHRWSTCPLHLAAAVALLLGVLTTALHAQTDPRNPDAVALPEIGRMLGELKCVTAVPERFGRQIYPIGDVNGDSLADWVLTHRRCDTSFTNGNAVIELLLYHGVRGGLPPTSAGLRIGPGQIDADCSFVGAGDYDGDGHRDLVIAISVLSDPINAQLQISSIVVFWNDRTGRYSLADTTHLTAPDERVSITRYDNERWARVPERCDVDRDGAEDLVVVTNGRHYLGGIRSDYPRVLIYRGHRHGGRWGRNRIGREPDWRLWTQYFSRRVSLLDHDDDGALDVVMYKDEDIRGRRGGVAICYGVRGTLPDTTPQVVDFVRVDDHDPKRCELVDVTGDRVPELIMSTGDSSDGQSRAWFIYAGRRGQRLLEQYGTGDDPPRPGDSLWWGRPWTVINTPYAVNPSWNGPMHPVFDVGDIGLDGVGDFCVYNYPSVNCYNGGRFLDSYIDAWMLVAPADLHNAWITRLGDVSGSGVGTIAVADDGGGAFFYRVSRTVPRTGLALRLPEGSDVPLSAPTTALRAPLPSLTLTPNPVSTTAHVRWSSREPASVALLDVAGRELRRWLLPAGEDELSIDVAGMPAGVYFVTVRAAQESSTIPFQVLP